MQMTCLAFVTATLYLLVQPRPKSVADAKNLNQRGSKRVTMLQCCAADTIEPLNVRGNKRVRLFLWSTWLMLTFLCVPFHTSKDLYFCKIAPMCCCKTQLLRNVLFVQCTMISKLLQLYLAQTDTQPFILVWLQAHSNIFFGSLHLLARKPCCTLYLCYLWISYILMDMI